MWELFLGVSLACFFAVYWLEQNNKPNPRQGEVGYAPSNEVLQYKTRKKAEDYSTSTQYASEEIKSPIRAVAPTYRMPEPPPFKPAENDEFVEYTASVVTEKDTSQTPNKMNFEANQPKNMEDDSENNENDEKKSKFSALRFFNS